MQVAIVLLGGLVLAFANGAYDNFKGAATLFGIGAVTRQARWRKILLAWVTTLPLGAALGATSLWIIRGL